MHVHCSHKRNFQISLEVNLALIYYMTIPMGQHLHTPSELSLLTVWNVPEI